MKIIIIIIIFYSWISLPIILAYVGCDKIENPTELHIFPLLVDLFLFELIWLVCYLSWFVSWLILSLLNS